MNTNPEDDDFNNSKEIFWILAAFNFAVYASYHISSTYVICKLGNNIAMSAKITIFLIFSSAILRTTLLIYAGASHLRIKLIEHSSLAICDYVLQ